MISDNYTLLEFFDVANFSAGFERAQWDSWGEVNIMQKLDIQQMFEIDGDAIGEVMGCYCEGHVDIQRFYGYAVCEWQELQQEKIDYGDIDEMPPIPFISDEVKQRYYRYPVDYELESGLFDSDKEFIFFDEPGDGLTPITYVEF